MTERIIFINDKCLSETEINKYSQFPPLSSDDIVEYISKLPLKRDSEIELKYVFFDNIYRYGNSDVETTIMNLLGEYEKLVLGKSHDIEIDGYPVARCIIKNDAFRIVELDTNSFENRWSSVNDFLKEAMCSCFKLIELYRQ